VTVEDDTDDTDDTDDNDDAAYPPVRRAIN
jgi:hypothetical protein